MKCQHTECKSKILSIGISCSGCNKKFCGKHRLPEMHFCENLQELKNKKFEENKQKLIGEKCVLKQL